MTRPLSARALRAARQQADHMSDRLAELGSAAMFHATVSNVVAGGAKDGNALVQVTYRGQTSTCAGYPDTYTDPQVGDRVLCVITRDHQLEIMHRTIGAP